MNAIPSAIMSSSNAATGGSSNGSGRNTIDFERARVIATSSSDEKLARARALGADAVINYREVGDWGARAAEIAGGDGVDQVDAGAVVAHAEDRAVLGAGEHRPLVGAGRADDDVLGAGSGDGVDVERAGHAVSLR